MGFLLDALSAEEVVKVGRIKISLKRGGRTIKAFVHYKGSVSFVGSFKNRKVAIEEAVKAHKVWSEDQD